MKRAVTRSLTRYVPRRFWHILFYLAVLAALALIYFYISVPNDGIKKLWNFTDGEDPFIAYRNLAKRDYFDAAKYAEEQSRVGPGEQGAPLIVPKGDDAFEQARDDLYRQNGYDALVSDRIALNRSVRDIRHPSCRGIKYIERLPSVSVIFPFHNEHFSTLLRSVYSVINRSPAGVVREVILVDDASTKDFLKQPLEDYWRVHGMNNVVRVVRTTKREGLIRARLVGARVATSDVLVFLDAHSEANYNWLPPLVEPIALNYRTVVCPFVDIVNCDTFEYKAQDEGARGSFDWEFNYKRLPLTADDLTHPSRPFRSPVMAGGYFAISAKWFWELGGYDDGLDIWGGEQYELSFKVWQCHGQLVDAPCSRVGHIYRCKYVPFPNPGVGDFISRNYRRVADVWMDEYKEFLFKRRPALREADAGDLSKQREVRERLNCRSFDWYMKNIAFDQDEYYPAVEPQAGASGEIRNAGTNLCIDTNFAASGEKFGLKMCGDGGEQTFNLGFRQDIRPEGRTMCFDVSTSDDRAPVTLFACHGTHGNQWFEYRPDTQQIYHKLSALCLDCDRESNAVFMRACDESSATQRWTWSTVRRDVLTGWARKNAAAREKGLR